MLDVCEELGNSTVKITTRQTIQLHGIVKDNLRPTIKRVNERALNPRSLRRCKPEHHVLPCGG